MFQEKTCSGPSVPIIIAACGILGVFAVFFRGRLAVQKLVEKINQKKPVDNELAAE